MSRFVDIALNDIRQMSHAQNMGRFMELYERYSNTINEASKYTRLSKQDAAVLAELDDGVMTVIEDAVDFLGDRLGELLIDFSS